MILSNLQLGHVTKTKHRYIFSSLTFQEALQLSTRVLESLLKVVSLIGSTVLTFGYAYAFLFLDLYGGSLLSSETGKYIFCTAEPEHG